jgi:hypothetical protein
MIENRSLETPSRHENVNSILILLGSLAEVSLVIVAGQKSLYPTEVRNRVPTLREHNG